MVQGINNIQLIWPLLDFTSDDEYYFIQVLQRKKDAAPGMKVNGSNNNSRLIKAYYIKSIEHLEFVMPEIIELCKLFNARAGINLNKRSFERSALLHLKKCTDQIMNKSFSKAHKAYPSIAGAHLTDSDRRWIIDLDGDETKLSTEILEVLEHVLPKPKNKFVAYIPSKNGAHLITTAFNVIHFKKIFPNIEIHKNNPTNLYIP